MADIEDPGQVRKRYGPVFDELLALLAAADPIRICDEHNPDEYEPETTRILPLLAACESIDAVRTVVYRCFVDLFDVDLAGPPDRYDLLARDISSRIVPRLRP